MPKNEDTVQLHLNLKLGLKRKLKIEAATRGYPTITAMVLEVLEDCVRSNNEPNKEE